MISIRFHGKTWAIMWAPAWVCAHMRWRWALQLGPISIIRRV